MTSKKPTTIDALMTPDPVTVAPSATVGQARAELSMGRIRHLPVVNDGVLVGLVSERDLHNVDDDSAPVSRVMTHDVQTIGIDTAAHEAAYLILRHAIGCVPITDGGVLVGIVTDTDFVRVAYSLLGGSVPVDELEAEEREADQV
jgi:acetoin utilization protein AcuB